MPPSAPLVALPSPVSAPGDIVGGFRLLRRLGIGGGSEIFLGIAQSGADDSGDPTAAVKVFGPLVEPTRIGAEIEALSRLHHDHLLQLADVALAPSGSPCLIVERLSAGSLSALVGDRSLTAGEAVTILAPIASALDSMHASGVVHGRLRLSSVLFRDSGAPVVVGFGGATLVAPGLPPARLAGIEGVLTDRRAAATIVAAVLARVAGESATGTDTARESDLMLDFEESDFAMDNFGAVLADRLFELAEPRPVRLAPAAKSGGPSAPVRIEPSRGVGGLRPAGATTQQVTRRRHAAAVETEGNGTRSRAVARAARLATRLPVLQPAAFHSGVFARAVAEHALGVRPRFWIAAAVAGASLLVGLVAVPTGDAGRTAGSGGGAAPGTPQAASPEDGTTEPGTPQPGTTLDPAASDDPLVAVTALLERRDQCIRDQSVLCLDGVAQPGSAALASDVALVRSIQAGGELPEDAAIAVGQPRLVERLGDSAIVDLGAGRDSTTASTLVMRGEAGWRIRDYLAAAPDG
ncbi:MAG: hypothetical protein JWM50_2507 [Microbacteriaceae bacterium]|nr:hypothetical protein [Microbacteriaceae bacterium]